MYPLIAVLVFILLCLFGLASISQSYATAKQAQAAIEASRTAQIASTGNLVTIMLVALLVIVVLVVLILIAYTYFQFKIKAMRSVSQHPWNAPASLHSLHNSQPASTDLLPSMVTLLLFQTLHQQQSRLPQPLLEEPRDEVQDSFNDFWMQ